MPKILVREFNFFIVSLFVCATVGATEPPNRASSVCSIHIVGKTITLNCAKTTRVANVDPITAGYEQLDAFARKGLRVDGETVTLNPEKLGRVGSPSPAPVTLERERDDRFEAGILLKRGYWSEGPVMFLVPSAAVHEPESDEAENRPKSDADTE